MKPKILVLDIETSPIIAHVWGLFDQNVGLNQVQDDWHVISWCAKWLGHKDVMYMDQRTQKDISNDKKIMTYLWELMDEADVLLTHNGDNFDIKKVNARFILHGMKPPSSFKKIDTLKIARSRFGFTSNKLAYLTDKLCDKYKKLEHKKFPGHTMWVECLKGNVAAWNEMEKYNKNDVLALEELYNKLLPWDTGGLNVNWYNKEITNKCKCGAENFKKNGFGYTSKGKFQRYVCLDCGSEVRDNNNLFSKEKRQSLKVGSR